MDSTFLGNENEAELRQRNNLKLSETSWLTNFSISSIFILGSCRPLSMRKAAILLSGRGLSSMIVGLQKK